MTRRPNRETKVIYEEMEKVKVSSDTQGREALKILKIGHSPDADDAFMFYALAKGEVVIDDYQIDHIMEDIESLNRRALAGELDVTAISAAIYPQVAESYRIMACGASVGRSYGPILVAKNPLKPQDLEGKRIGIPGAHTTAYLLLRLYLEPSFQPMIMPFDAILEAVEAGQVDAGVIIHEGQITWKKQGLLKILDLGEEWARDTSLPIPLGLDIVHRRLGKRLTRKIAKALKDSIQYARANEDDALDYALEYGRGIDRETCRRFVRMYVNDDTVNMGKEGQKALETLYYRAWERGLAPTLPSLDIVGLK